MEWNAVRSYFETQGVSKLVEHQIESFEDFIRNKLPLIVSSTAPIVVWHEQDETTKKYKYEFRLSFENITYMKPRIQEATGRIKPMFPQEARMRNFTYSAQMFSDVRFVARTYRGPGDYDEQVKIFEGVSLGKIPVMLGSSLCIMKDYPLTKKEIGECTYDPFGYFIIHGSERTILCQEKVADNRIMVFYNKKTASKYTYSVEMKSLHESFTTPPKKLEIRLSSKFNGLGYPLTICVPRFREDVPLMVMFRALGLENDQDIANLVIADNHGHLLEMLAASFKECSDIKVHTREDAIEYLTHHLQYGTTNEDKKAYVRSILETEYLPHVRFGGDVSNIKTLEARKCILTAWMVRRLLMTEKGLIPIDDRDAYPNKRIVTTGSLLTHLFRQLFQKVCKDIRSKFVHEVNNDSWKKGETPHPLEVLNVNNLYKILKVSTIEGKLKQALATGNFTVQGLGTSSSTSLSNATKVGVSQVLNRLSYSATISHLRRIQTPVEKSGKLLAPRKLHGTSWGYVCPVETPEGHSVGIVKALSMLTAISQHTPSSVTIKLLEEIPEITWIQNVAEIYRGTSIVVNGVIAGYTTNPVDVHKYLRQAKRDFRLHPHTGVAWNIVQNSITIESDGGRFIRPLFRVENGKLAEFPTNPTCWNDWIRKCVEYIDPSETEVIRVAMTPADITKSHTHCEIHPTLVLGHMANSIPLSDQVIRIVKFIQL
jgi:DNA-directed RNA polymerase II subunit RPB2